MAESLTKCYVQIIYKFPNPIQTKLAVKLIYVLYQSNDVISRYLGILCLTGLVGSNSTYYRRNSWDSSQAKPYY